MFVDRRYRLPRIWSNRRLQHLAPLFDGEIAHISAWDDRDKEGRDYRSYFVNARSYTITNYTGERGLTGDQGEIFLDLTKDPPGDLLGRFDVCFNHTTLEHIFDVRKAFHTLCRISRDVVICVVPFSQTQHETTSFQDFWRFTPSALRRLYTENDLEVVYEAQNEHQNAGIYLFFVGSKQPDRWRSRMPVYRPITEAGKSIGQRLLKSYAKRILFKTKLSRFIREAKIWSTKLK